MKLLHHSNSILLPTQETSHNLGTQVLQCSSNSLLAILVLAIIALLIVLSRLWSRQKGKSELSRDATGLWKYHHHSEFERVIAFADIQKKEKKETGKRRFSFRRKASGAAKKLAVAVLTFEGDIRGKQHKSFARLVDEVEVNKDDLNEVVVILSSPGGMVSQYGHAFSEMERMRNLGLNVTACVDVVAASGGYLMCLPANKVVAAPFAVVGSVGVVAFVPNIRKLLLDWKITPRTFVAGKYKHPVGLTDDASGEDIAHFQNQLEAIHRLFLSAVKKYRPSAKLKDVATGEHWTATESMELSLGLVDEIGTSNDYLLKKNRENDLIYMDEKRSFWDDGLWGMLGRVGTRFISP